MRNYYSVAEIVFISTALVLVSLLSGVSEACGPSQLTRVEKKGTGAFAGIPEEFKPHQKTDGTLGVGNTHNILLENASTNSVECTINVSPDKQITGHCVNNLVSGMPGLCQSPDGKYIDIHAPCASAKPPPMKKRLRRASQQYR
ncbi:uncharacterized protein LOC129586899 [Paramacrobiotus metropolitanus]|uniref:uncharacterized protein LOC129586899 n=1 Tax=Paramacrobiotus metropolitanus TaxID=2943436 RepID=UPI002445AE21|nr:uncharacterized protein LOC129586899 [Paramacrobiotus metropolitanus]XP_055336360.1 uncharacterized protein LOC129586899 [Paramacrobiotus metropolitanus]XP_055336361.1 uncharacterized protein LOC129586899 [Paramacrobiotus metropolitanus]